MSTKPIVIIVEDDPNWLRDLNEIVGNHFDVVIEIFASFTSAEKRIMENFPPFNLLITDVFPSNSSREEKGLQFAQFTHSINKIPVIVITGEPSSFKKSLRDSCIIDVFDKGTFERLDFITSVGKVLPSLNNPANEKMEPSSTKTISGVEGSYKKPKGPLDGPFYIS